MWRQATRKETTMDNCGNTGKNEIKKASQAMITNPKNCTGN